MSKKITISIPDILHKRLEKHRNRIAISNVCAEAISAEIEHIDDCIKEIKRRFRLLTQREICSLAYKEGRHWAGYEATLEDLAIVSCWIGSDEEEPDWFERLSDRVKKKTDAWSTVEELVMHSFMSGNIIIRSDENDFDYYMENHDTAMDFIRGAREIWWEIENEAIEILTSSK
ncbi:MAG: hypothetical protein MI862_01660 [Desulfobacterales bacterium]|nr:hypothetical protein [Desulfobacterales bacterium]